jgi:hypothetical protein
MELIYRNVRVIFPGEAVEKLSSNHSDIVRVFRL